MPLTTVPNGERLAGGAIVRSAAPEAFLPRFLFYSNLFFAGRIS
jgi:hypothetical protein